MRAAAMKLTPLKDPSEVELERIDQDPRYKAVAAEYGAIEARLAEAERRQRIAQARSRGQQSTTSFLDRAAALISGGQVIAATPRAELEASGEEIEILYRALGAKREELDTVGGEISFEACSRFAPMNAAALVNALEAATELHQALEVARVIRARLITGGYQLNATALPTHWFPTGAAVGDPDRVGQTPAAMFKTWLRDNGIIR
jgi:hypothetical protein